MLGFWIFGKDRGLFTGFFQSFLGFSKDRWDPSGSGMDRLTFYQDRGFFQEALKILSLIFGIFSKDRGLFSGFFQSFLGLSDDSWDPSGSGMDRLTFYQDRAFFQEALKILSLIFEIFSKDRGLFSGFFQNSCTS